MSMKAYSLEWKKNLNDFSFISRDRQHKFQTKTNSQRVGWLLNHIQNVIFFNDPSAGSPTETLLRLLLPLNDQVCPTF